MAAPRDVAAILRRRGLQAIGVVVAVSTLCFVIVSNLPGDIALRIAAGRYGYDRVSAASAEAVRAELALDQPVWRQLTSWWIDLLQLDLGRSLVTNAPVVTELAHHLSASLLLAATALAVALLIGGPLGAGAARRPGGFLDRTTTTWISLTRALPPFLLGLLLILAFSVHLRWVPAAGHGGLEHLVLPTMTLAVGLSGLFAGITRDAVLEVRRSDYVRFAETKGLSPRSVFRRHVARNSGVTVVSYVGVQALVLIEGVVIVESVFAWPGLGHALVHAVFWRDLPMLQASALALALLVVGINAAVDVAGSAIDPRPRVRERVR